MLANQDLPYSFIFRMVFICVGPSYPSLVDIEGGCSFSPCISLYGHVQGFPRREVAESKGNYTETLS